MCSFVRFGECFVLIGLGWGRAAHKWGDQLAEVYGVRCFPKDRVKDEGFTGRCNGYWRGVSGRCNCCWRGVC
jgi:hypothetical protein